MPDFALSTVDDAYCGDRNHTLSSLSTTISLQHVRLANTKKRVQSFRRTVSEEALTRTLDTNTHVLSVEKTTTHATSAARNEEGSLDRTDDVLVSLYQGAFHDTAVVALWCNAHCATAPKAPAIPKIFHLNKSIIRVSRCLLLIVVLSGM